LFSQMGYDFSGPNVVECNCDECKEKIYAELDTIINDWCGQVSFL
jgi:hypothetical protein